MNFLDPKFNDDGEPYGPWRFKEIVRELYAIAKNTNTPYTDLLQITPRERDYLKEFIMETNEELQREIEERRQEMLAHQE